MSLDKELASLVHDFNSFAFHIPRGRKQREVWKFWMGLWGTIGFLWGVIFFKLI